MGKISVNGVGKAYRQYSSPWARLAEWIVPGSKQRHNLIWVLKEIEFQVNAGEAVGIAGMNGAGKSTLLKMITGITQPTQGSVEVQGSVAALLELGMGFHPDFTGRQNVIMAGQLLGLTVDEIDTLMPDIESFAEIGAYIDQPVRTYSSGMIMRLAFSVATARRPDILVIDEALSVGDAYFQHKSFERIRQISKEGTTLLIVSHDRNAIQTICDRVILLDGGELVKQGPPEDVMDYYNALMADREYQRIRQEKTAQGVRTISGSGEVSISGVRLLNMKGEVVELVETGEELVLEVKATVNEPVSRLVLGFMIKDRFGQPMYGINTHRVREELTDLTKGEEVEYRFSFDANLGKGNYSIAFSLSQADSHLDKNYEWRDRAVIFHVVNCSKEDFVGCVWLNAKVGIVRHRLQQVVCE